VFDGSSHNVLYGSTHSVLDGSTDNAFFPETHKTCLMVALTMYLMVAYRRAVDVSDEISHKFGNSRMLGVRDPHTSYIMVPRTHAC